jgi:hypothetical protein
MLKGRLSQSQVVCQWKFEVPLKYCRWVGWGLEPATARTTLGAALRRLSEQDRPK